jgi:hypothetical protein
VHLHLPPGGGTGVAVLLNSHGGDTPPNPAPPPRYGWDGGLWNPKLDPPDHLLQRYPNPLGTPRHLHRVELQGLMVEGVQVGYRRSGTHLMTIATEPPPDHPADPRHLTASLCWATVAGSSSHLTPNLSGGAQHIWGWTRSGRDQVECCSLPPSEPPKPSTSVCTRVGRCRRTPTSIHPYNRQHRDPTRAPLNCTPRTYP